MDTQQQSRFGRIPDAKRRSGLSRGKLYGLAAEHAGLFRKAGTATIVDLKKLDTILAELPAAEIQRTERIRHPNPRR